MCIWINKNTINGVQCAKDTMSSSNGAGAVNGLDKLECLFKVIERTIGLNSIAKHQITGMYNLQTTQSSRRRSSTQNGAARNVKNKRSVSALRVRQEEAGVAQNAAQDNSTQDVVQEMAVTTQDVAPNAMAQGEAGQRNDSNTSMVWNSDDSDAWQAADDDINLTTQFSTRLDVLTERLQRVLGHS